MGLKNGIGKKRVVIYSTIILVSIVALFTVSYIVGNKYFFAKKSIVNAADKDAPNNRHLKSANVDRSHVAIEKNEPRDQNNDPRNQSNQPVNHSFVNPYNSDGHKVAYVTFDDGPSPNNTPQILDILKRYNIKATFFIIGRNAEMNPQLLVRERNEGHELAVHSYSHDQRIIYVNPNSYLSDIAKCAQVISGIVGDEGYNKSIIRFPGGSTSVNKGFVAEIEKAGYHHVDWNALNGDAEHPYVPVDKLVGELKNTVGNQEHVVILMHDAQAKTTTVQALPIILDYLKEKGYEFRTL
ncbi:MAG: polysaccharide deacetylase family protein [Bacillota bacterium]|nr:polysaccharide deacetylase family protein [Bacillota bacterium]